MAHEEHVVHEHDSGSSAGLLIGIALVVIVLLFLFFYGPSFLGGGSQINVPGTIDVNVNK